MTFLSLYCSAYVVYKSHNASSTLTHAHICTLLTCVCVHTIITDTSKVRELVHSTAQQFGLDLRVYEGSFVKGLQRCMAEMEAETTVGTTVDTTVGTAVGQQRRTGPLAFGFVLG